jgi:hypothetical protein
MSLHVLICYLDHRLCRYLRGCPGIAACGANNHQCVWLYVRACVWFAPFTRNTEDLTKSRYSLLAITPSIYTLYALICPGVFMPPSPPAPMALLHPPPSNASSLSALHSHSSLYFLLDRFYPPHRTEPSPTRSSKGIVSSPLLCLLVLVCRNAMSATSKSHKYLCVFVCVCVCVRLCVCACVRACLSIWRVLYVVPG